MEVVCNEVDKALLMSELTKERFLRYSNKGGNEIYTFTAHDAPNLMREVGRIRELTFRDAGGGTGKSCDLDEFDLREDNPCIQLIVWDPDAQMIIGGYRFLQCKNLTASVGNRHLMALAEIFEFSDAFIKEYMPYTIELGRSFVHPLYQSTQMARKSLYALDNLWDGLGALTVKYPDIKYFLGKVTMYTSFNIDARNMILHFMNTYFADSDKLMQPIGEYALYPDVEKIQDMFKGNDYNEEHKLLSKAVRDLGTNIPPLINAYMGLSSTMKVFGTSINPFFGGVEETAIMIKIDDIHPSKKDRHIATYNLNEV